MLLSLRIVIWWLLGQKESYISWTFPAWSVANSISTLYRPQIKSISHGSLIACSWPPASSQGVTIFHKSMGLGSEQHTKISVGSLLSEDSWVKLLINQAIYLLIMRPTLWKHFWLLDSKGSSVPKEEHVSNWTIWCTLISLSNRFWKTKKVKTGVKRS